MSDLERAQAELAELVAEGQELAMREESTSTDLVVSGGAEAMREELLRLRTQAERHRVLMRAKAEEVASIAESERERMRAIERQAKAALEPVEAMLKQLGEGLKTIGLYLGTGEQIVELRDGEPAPVDTPVTIRQMVLRMDEECAVAVDEGGIDARNFSEFDTWLLEDPAHVQQVIPEPKGVVCLTPRDPARSKDTGNAWADSQVKNEQTYWLIRNGDRLYRTDTDFIVGAKLVPSPDEFERLFFTEERDTETWEMVRKPIRPGSRDWEQAQERVEEHERHFYRVALILEGLLHRTPVFHPAPHDLSFLDPAAHAAGRVRFILDMEAALGDGHEQFGAYLRRLNAQLRPGMRIVGTFEGRYERDGFGSLRYEGRTGGFSNRHRRLAPETASWPEDGVIYELEHVQGKRLGFKYDRTDEVYVDRYGSDGRWIGSKAPERRASCVVEPGDDWIIPFDLVSEEDLRRFLSYRTDRREYLSMFPLIKAVIRAKRYERELEQPFRVMLAGVLARDNGVTVAEAETAVPELVEWFKTTNRWHRPLIHETPPEPEFDAFTASGRRRSDAPSDDEIARLRDRWHRDLAKAQEGAVKAVRMITAEHERRVRIARRKPVPGLLSELREARYPSAVMVGRRRSDGKYIVVVPERSDEEVWATVVVWGPRKGLESEERWQLVSKAQAARWQVLWAHERWERWDHEARADRHLTDPELVQLTERARRAAEGTDEAPQRRRVKRSGDDPVGPVLAITREGMTLTAYVKQQDPVLPHPVLPLSHPSEMPGVTAVRGEVVGQTFPVVRTPEGHLQLRPPRHGARESRWTSSFMGRGRRAQRSALWGAGEQPLWQDGDAIRELREALEEYDRRRDHANDLWAQVNPFVQSIREQWTAAWWEAKRKAWVDEYGKPELWEGQRKVIENRRSRSYERLEPPMGGVRELVGRFVEVGEGERLWGRTVADLFDEARARGWTPLTVDPEDGEGDTAELDPSLMELRFTPEPDEEPEPDDVEFDGDDDFDTDATVELAELTAGDIEDAEVVE